MPPAPSSLLDENYLRLRSILPARAPPIGQSVRPGCRHARRTIGKTTQCSSVDMSANLSNFPASNQRNRSPVEWARHEVVPSILSSDTTPVLCEQLQAISFDTYRPPPREMLVWSVMSYAMPGTSGKTLPAPASPGSQQTGLLTPTAPSSLRVNDPLATALPTPSRMPRCAARLQPPLYSQSIATRLQPRCAVPTLTLTYGLCSSRVGTATARVSRLRRRPEPRARQPWLPPEQSVVLQAG
jgi:hypothetical protein